ncbi:putative Acetyltransferase, GNAT family [uncultured spirochete]|uniref:Putative Acetyltransferase, GNAT family n=1 Tax=uncultured spirochete TaxID=156406 RepID=A0A3P3XK18_9SPIR|nr:GNAT family N-acetyltransferase [Rectinema subterraneum]SLM13606.1 putative Acetyltransferase, GNAT family [uncultured spirochete]
METHHVPGARQENRAGSPSLSGRALMIRSATLEDSPALASLAGQLGYPASPEKVRERLPRYIGAPEARVIVAEHEGQVIGWTSIEVVDHFYLDKFAEISGFVVDERFRGQGVGHALMQEAERWTAAHGLSTLRLKTNVVREDAHRFYENLGFERTKTQYTYVKKLARLAADL